jgi:hypothetical protein
MAYMGRNLGRFDQHRFSNLLWMVTLPVMFLFVSSGLHSAMGKWETLFELPHRSTVEGHLSSEQSASQGDLGSTHL